MLLQTLHLLRFLRHVLAFTARNLDHALGIRDPVDGLLEHNVRIIVDKGREGEDIGAEQRW